MASSSGAFPIAASDPHSSINSPEIREERITPSSTIHDGVRDSRLISEEAASTAAPRAITSPAATQQPASTSPPDSEIDSFEEVVLSTENKTSTGHVASTVAANASASSLRAASPPAGPRVCRICLEEEGDEDILQPTDEEALLGLSNDFIQPCACRGTGGWVHRLCLRRWRKTGGSSARAKCPVCGCNYNRDELGTVSASTVTSNGHDTNPNRIPATIPLVTGASMLLDWVLSQRLAHMVSNEGQPMLQQPQSRPRGGLATISFSVTDQPRHDSMAPPPPSKLQSFLGTLAVVLVLALLVGWLRGDSDVLEWLQGTFTTVVVVCCTPIAIIYAALPVVSNAFAAGMGGRAGDYERADTVFRVVAWVLTLSIMAVAIVGDSEHVMPLRLVVAAVVFPATCCYHYVVVKRRYLAWQRERLDEELRGLEEQWERDLRDLQRLGQQQEQRQAEEQQQRQQQAQQQQPGQQQQQHAGEQRSSSSQRSSAELHGSFNPEGPAASTATSSPARSPAQPADLPAFTTEQLDGSSTAMTVQPGNRHELPAAPGSAAQLVTGRPGPSTASASLPDYPHQPQSSQLPGPQHLHQPDDQADAELEHEPLLLRQSSNSHSTHDRVLHAAQLAS